MKAGLYVLRAQFMFLLMGAIYVSFDGGFENIIDSLYHDDVFLFGELIWCPIENLPISINDGAQFEVFVTVSYLPIKHSMYMKLFLL